MDIKQIVLDLGAMSDEQEGFGFKENWFQPEALGEYVSALSNAAAFHYKKFEGKTKGTNLFSVRELGNNCLLYSLDELLRYGDVLNIIQADETDRVVERKEVPLFDNKAFREAIINAVLHNK